MAGELVATATIGWQDSIPYNKRYGDIYYSPDGADEVARVFIDPADLPMRLQNRSNNDTFTIAETGFGSGLNFLCAADLALQHRQRLHFISVEAHPLTKNDFARINETRPQRLAKPLVRHYPPSLSGWHQRQFADGQIVLSLYIGDVATFAAALREAQRAGIDALFLDGFAPDRNPDMWQIEALRTLAETCNDGATVTTFTAAGAVRRGLAEAGFTMRRVDQRPFKRESLAGTLNAQLSQSTKPPVQSPATVQVVGAGIAGASVARHLADSGVEVLVRESADRVAAYGSSVTALQHSRLLGDGSPLAAWRASCYNYATAYTFGRAGVHPIGANQHTGPNLDAPKVAKIARAYQASGDWIRLTPEGDALQFPDTAVVELPKLVADLLAHPNIELTLNAVPLPELPTVWANGAGVAALGFDLPVRELWGQLDFASGIRLEAARLHNGYAVPVGPEEVMLGATYEYAPWDPQDATEANLARLDEATTSHRRIRAMRAVASDRTPIIGELAPNQWITAAHGSMGATSAHIAAAILCADICGRVVPQDAAVLRLIHPKRFAERLRRRSPAR